MIKREEHFKDVVQQLSASREALNKVFAAIIADAAEELLNDKGTVNVGRHVKLMALVKIIAQYG